MKKIVIIIMLLISSIILIGCNNKEYTRDEKYIYFGMYPQSKVEDENLITTLNDLSGTLPTKENSSNWQSYQYYVKGKVEDFMWYIDIENEGIKYRGVYFTSYRPYDCYYEYSSEEDTYQTEYGYEKENVYWFKYEQVKWKILKEENNKALVVTDLILDSQNFYHCEETRNKDSHVIYPSNYEESDIRQWLNNLFLNTTFNNSQKKLIEEIEVDNSIESLSEDYNEYTCNNTNDKIFLLS